MATNPSTATLDYTMSGDPVLQPIRGTQLNYVANASVPIIQLDIDNWYAVQEGVWFHATEATGPWTVTNQIPPEIYAIPRRSRSITPFIRASSHRAATWCTTAILRWAP